MESLFELGIIFGIIIGIFITFVPAYLLGRFSGSISILRLIEEKIIRENDNRDPQSFKKGGQ